MNRSTLPPPPLTPSPAPLDRIVSGVPAALWLSLVLLAFASPAAAERGATELNHTCATLTGCVPGDARRETHADDGDRATP